MISILFIGKWNFYFQVESSCSKQRLVNHFKSVGWSDYKYVLLRCKSIHLWKELIYCWIFLTSSSIVKHTHILTISYSIYFIDIYDWWCSLFCFLKQIFYSFRTDSDINFTELRSIAWIKWYISFSCCSLR